MNLRYACLILTACTVAWTATAYAQSTQPVVKFPTEIEFKAPLSPGSQTAVLYGDPTKPGVYVQRTKFPTRHPGHAALAPRRVAHRCGLVRNAVFRCRRTVGRKQTQGLSDGHVLFGTAKDATLRLGERWRGHHPNHGHGANGHDAYSSKLIAIGVGPARQSLRLLDHLGFAAAVALGLTLPPILLSCAKDVDPVSVSHA
jgi:hypothetical protein